jgi:hypothetical protein
MLEKTQMKRYPRGKLSADDEGEITMSMYWKDGAFIIDFGKDVKWIGLDKVEAQEFALRILRMTADRVISEFSDLEEKGRTP